MKIVPHYAVRKLEQNCSRIVALLQYCSRRSVWRLNHKIASSLKDDKKVAKDREANNNVILYCINLQSQ